VGGGVDEVAVGAGSVGPFAVSGFTFHPGDNPVDDDFALEFGERAEHLDEQPPGSGRSNAHAGAPLRFAKTAPAGKMPGADSRPLPVKDVRPVAIRLARP
jgi:hypothetical protein